MNLTTLITTLEQTLTREITSCKQYDYGNTITYKNLNSITINNTEYAADQLFLIPSTGDVKLCVLFEKIVNKFLCSEIETISI